MRSCASCEPASLEFAHEAGNQGRRRARASSGSRERAPGCGVVAAQPAGHRVPAADGEDVSGVGVLTAAARPWESESCSSSPRCHQVTGAGVCAPQRVPGSAGCLGQGVLCSPMWLRGWGVNGGSPLRCWEHWFPRGLGGDTGSSPSAPRPAAATQGGVTAAAPLPGAHPGCERCPLTVLTPSPHHWGKTGAVSPTPGPVRRAVGRAAGWSWPTTAPLRTVSGRDVSVFGAVSEQTPPCPP